MLIGDDDVPLAGPDAWVAFWNSLREVAKALKVFLYMNNIDPDSIRSVEEAKDLLCSRFCSLQDGKYYEIDEPERLHRLQSDWQELRELRREVAERGLGRVDMSTLELR